MKPSVSKGNHLKCKNKKHDLNKETNKETNKEQDKKNKKIKNIKNIKVDILDDLERTTNIETSKNSKNRKNYYKSKEVKIDIKYEKLEFNYTKIEKYTVTPYEKIQSKPVSDYNTYALKKLNRYDKLRTILITCNTFPENEYTNAWHEAIEERENIVKYISKKWEKNVKIVVSTIEHHHTINKNLKEKLEVKYIKSEEESDDEEGSDNEEVSDDEDDKKKKITRSKMSIYDIYMSKTLDIYLEKISKLKQDKRVLADMTEEQMIVTYYNILQTLRYLNGEANRKRSMLEYISDEQKIYSEVMIEIINGTYENESVIFSYRKLALISHHKRIGNNLLGYPHLHIAVSYTGIINPDKFRNEVHDYIMAKGMYDVRVDKTITKEAEDEGNGITYVMKNHKNKYVNDKLKEYAYKKSVVQMYLNISNKRYIEYAKGFVERGDKAHYQPINMEVYSKLKKYDEYDESSEEYINEKIDPEKDDYNKILSYILSVMKSENNEFVICDGEIYKKVKRSKMTYRPHMTIDVFIETITSVSPMNKVSPKWKQDIIKLMKITDDDEELTDKTDFVELSESYRPKFPRIKIDHRMIEYEDFYFNTLTTKIYKIQNKYYCYYYAEGYGLDDLKDNLKTFEKESDWNDILKMNKLNTRMVYALLFELLRPKNVKGLTPVLYGASNAGKSTLFSPFRSYYPKTKVSSLDTKLNGHYVADLLCGKELVIVEEGNTILNDDSSTSILLKALEGANVISDKKHGEIKDVKQTARIVMAINIKAGDTYIDKKELMNRLYFIGYMKSLKNLKVVHDSIKQDEALIYLYCGLEFMRLSKEEDNQDFFEIIEELGEEEDKEIVNIKNYYEMKNIKTVNRYKLVKNDQKEDEHSSNMKNEDNQRKTKYNITRKVEAKKIKNMMNNI